MNSLDLQGPGERWRALARRDAAADGRFVYAVKTTGVFCRPSCPSRRPLARNVVYFDTASAAERAGFRPCRRCHPEREVSPRDDTLGRVRATCRAIEAAEAPPRLTALAAAAGLSRFHFQRLFKRVVGVTPREYYVAHRRERFQRALAGGGSVDAAVYGAGFGSASRVYERADALLGMSPAVYARGAAGEQIRCGFARSALGWIAVAATDRGVCAIELGSGRAALAERLAERFPRAAIDAADSSLGTYLAAIVAFIERPAQAEPVSLCPRTAAIPLAKHPAQAEPPLNGKIRREDAARRRGHAVGLQADADGGDGGGGVVVAPPLARMQRTPDVPVASGPIHDDHRSLLPRDRDCHRPCHQSSATGRK